MRIWSHENPHEFIEEPLQPQKTGVWAAISERRIIAVRYRNEILKPTSYTMMNCRTDSFNKMELRFTGQLKFLKKLL